MVRLTAKGFYEDTSDGLRNSAATVVPNASSVISEIVPREITQ